MTDPVREPPGMEPACDVQAPLRLCFVTREYLGYHKCGGIGTAVTAWARIAAAAGHAVTVLLTGDASGREASCAPPGPAPEPVIRFLPPASINILGSPPVAVAYRVFTALAAEDYDVVLFHDWLGQGFYSLMAKHQGLAFRDTLLCVVSHGATAWTCEANRRFPQSLEELEAQFLERQSVALADVLLSPNRYMLDWMRGRGWTLPGQVRVLPYCQNAPDRAGPVGSPRPAPPTELVFFGRLEHRKGVSLFCDALDLLRQGGATGCSVTFLGSVSQVDGLDAGEYLRRRGGDWPFPWRILGDMDRDGALDYLRQGDRLAVIPSLLDNSPNTVHECAAHAIPFLAADVGGIGEIVAPGDRERVLFAPRARDLAEKLAAALVRGVRPAGPALPPEAARRAWLDWLAALGRDRARTAAEAGEAAHAPPRVSVCLTHHDRPRLLRQALDSLRAQDYPDFEVVLVDDGSVLPESDAMLRELETAFAARDWLLLRQENRYLGAARNAAAAAARGEYLLFMDDDNLARPREISTFVRAARAGGADILTCLACMFDDAQPLENAARSLFVPLGGAVDAGFYKNVFGDANALVKKDVFQALGGFSEDRDLGFEDWEFFANAVLAGYTLEVVPFALFDYRSSPSGMLKTTSGHHNTSRALRPYLARAPRALAPALLLGREAALRSAAAAQELQALGRDLARERERRIAAEAACASPLETTEGKGPGRPVGARRLSRFPLLELPARMLARLRRERDARLLRACPEFDAAWYLAANPDVAASGCDPAFHYLAHGACEGRDPGPGFDSRFYLDANRDVAAAGINPLLHYLRHGRAEGRCPRRSAPAVPRGMAALERAGAADGGAGRPLVVCPACDWAVSGVHSLTERLGLALLRRGWDFRILFTVPRAEVLQSAGGRLPQTPHDFLPVAHLPDAAYDEALAGYFGRQGPCVCLCGYDFRANAAAARLPAHVGLVVVAHSDESVYYDQAVALGARCRAVVCVSSALAHKVGALPGLAGKTVRIANSGIAASEVRLRTAMAAPALSCIYTGRLVQEQKRVLDCIALARCLDAVGLPYRISLVGQDFGGAEAVLRRELKTQIERGSIRLPGRLGREALLAALDRHNFFLLFSDYEGLSVSLTEAMGRGCVPLAAAGVSGNDELVIPGKNGMLMPHRDYRAWAAWLAETARDEAGWLRLSRAAGETVRASFTLERFVARFDALLHSCREGLGSGL